MPLSPLLGYQRKWLRGRAHGLQPIVEVGRAGLSDAVLTAVDQALLDHELVKVRLHKPENKKHMAQQLASGVEAHLCGLIGHTVILYRRHPEDPRIQVPEREESP